MIGRRDARRNYYHDNLVSRCLYVILPLFMCVVGHINLGFYEKYLNAY